jgi:hypothetical protein
MKWIGLIAGFAAAWCLTELFGLRAGLLAMGAIAGLLFAHLQGRARALATELAALKRALLPEPIEPFHRNYEADIPVEAPLPETANADTELSAAGGDVEADDEAADPDQPDTIPVPPHVPAVHHETHRAARTHLHPAGNEAQGRWPAIVKSLRASLASWRR